MFEDQLATLQDYIAQHRIHIVNLIYVGFTAIIVVFGNLVIFVESKLPASVRQSFRYGKHSYTGKPDTVVSLLEVPKGWFKHFYVFAFTWSLLALYLLLKGIILKEAAPEVVLQFLDTVAGGRGNRPVLLNSSTALMATVLMTLQCGRRFYETNFVQIFSKSSKMNLSHYAVGYLHYFGAIIALVANTEGFVAGTKATTFQFTQISVLQMVCLGLFHTCWTQQYKSNMILVNLRKDAKTGQVKTEKHLMPTGGFFQFVSSPHMFFEVAMYLVLLAFMHQSFTWWLVCVWVVSNQIMNALLTHDWYKQTFPNYPKNRKAIIPFIL